MTSLSTLVVTFALTAAVLTLLTYWLRRIQHVGVSLLQYFCGVWFIFSGAVKAIDPIGTAYKMEDYFTAFESTFGGLQNGFAKLAPVFPVLARYSEGFSIGMIALEIVLGVMLVLGFWRRLTAWLFFLLLLFFTFLTGFTYLTGFVPPDANFFDWAKWGPYVKTQMRVTDCGCFGDFIKLDPKVSFLKDVFLLVPALIFLGYHHQMHQLFTARGRRFLTGIVALTSVLFCGYSTYYNLPLIDFRPFKVGTNVRERRALEQEARSNIEIIGWVMENERTGKVEKVMIPMSRYREVMERYPKSEGWRVKEQIKTEPFVEINGKRIVIQETKISDFAIESESGDITEELLQYPGYSLMIVAYKLHGQKTIESFIVQDTVWAYDTLRTRASDSIISISPRVVEVTPRKVMRETFIPEAWYADIFRNEINAVAQAAQKQGWRVYAVTTFQDSEMANDFRQKVGADYPFHHADDKLLKTIIRSNPGLVVWHDGSVVGMYHWRHLPTPDALLRRFH
ncbi:MAG: DoxX family protein [Saprospiraceae bacterium]|nr:DoxX family protein [Saprospiraceae bacterium]MDW8483079.1 DoxX family protein [Saprospiraceae bacterium]